MADSLRDQLLKSGLAKKFKSENIESEAKPERPPRVHVTKAAPMPQRPPPAKAPSQSEVDLARAYALRAQQKKLERERTQREAEKLAREKKERKQKLAALLEGKSLNLADADVPRHFPHGNKIRRIYCSQEQLGQLNRGELAVVQLAGRYLLVLRDVALQAQAIQAETLVLLCDPNALPEDDVPADLVW
jgi:uncharacterized protein YaiL (DUF2058 family)